MVYSGHLTWVKHGILFIPVSMKKCSKYMFPAMYYTLWWGILGAEKWF